MAWEVRGQRRYYYRTRRVDGTVKRVYLGAGDIAERAAAKDAATRTKRATDQAELAALQARLAGTDQLSADVQHGVDSLTEATLLSLGFHQHRGQWREYRHDHRA